MRNNIVSLILIALLALVSAYIVWPTDHPLWLESALARGEEESFDLRDLKLGLDLQGGTQVLLETDLEGDREAEESDMAAAKIIVENRVNGLGVAEAIVQQQGANRLVVELPGVGNPDQAVETIRSTGQLEFVEPAGAPLGPNLMINTTNRPAAASDLLAQLSSGAALVGDVEPFMPDTIFETVMTGDILQNAVPTQNEFGQWQINFSMTDEGSSQFFEYTNSHVGRPLPIVLDGRVLSAPVIRSAIRDSGVIDGSFTQEEVDSLAVQMRYGALPVPLKVVDVRTIGASLGQDSVDRSLKAGLLGLLGILTFMLIIYRVPGLLAAGALIIYLLLNLMFYKLIPVTLTLAGIAGLVLSLGMAVDANILIFERMKEELRVGRSLRVAVEAGFSRAWPAIRDGNVSTLISCAVLWWFGNNFGASIVKGFAITLSIGVLLSMFTAVFVTRTFMRSVFASNRTSADGNTRTLIGY